MTKCKVCGADVDPADWYDGLCEECETKHDYLIDISDKVKQEVNIMIVFDLHDKVEITPLNLEGRVIAIYISEDGVQYHVRYFDNAEARTVYFYADELAKIQ